jgi:hypothetical protein
MATTTSLWISAAAALAIGDGPNLDQPIEFIALPIVEPAGANESSSLKLASEKTTRWPKFFRQDGWRKPTPPEPPKDPPRRNPFNGIFGKKDNTPSDWLLVSRCRSLLYRDPQLAQSSIYVSSDEGTISLRGTVTSELLRVRAEEIAKKTDGQRGVRNDLVVMNEQRPFAAQPPVSLAPPSGDEVAGSNNAIPPANVVPAPPTLESKPAVAESGGVAPSIPAVGGPPEPVDDVIRRSVGSAVSQESGLGGGVVVLGQPEVMSQRPGRPQVVSYLIRRPIDAAPELDPSMQAVAGLRVPSTLDSLRVAKTSLDPSQYSVGRAAAPKRPVIPAPQHRSEWAPVAAEPARPVIQSPPAGLQYPASEFSPTPAPTVAQVQAAPMAPAASRPDVEALFVRFVKPNQMRYEVRGGELILFGQVRSAKDLELLTSQLGQLSGIQSINFENVQIVP